MTIGDLMKEKFNVTTVCRDDVAHHFGNYNWCGHVPKKYAKISDADMEAIASIMQDKICECDFWTALDIAGVKVMGYKSKL